MERLQDSRQINLSKNYRKVHKSIKAGQYNTNEGNCHLAVENIRGTVSQVIFNVIPHFPYLLVYKFKEISYQDYITAVLAHTKGFH